MYVMYTNIGDTDVKVFYEIDENKTVSSVKVYDLHDRRLHSLSAYYDKIYNLVKEHYRDNGGKQDATS